VFEYDLFAAINHGDWYALSPGWNNKQASLGKSKMFAVLQQILK